MATYRDGDPSLRIDTLEAKLAERDASLVARDAELAELRAAMARSSEDPRVAPARRLFSGLAMGATLTAAALGFAYVGLRLETARVRAVAAAQLTKLSAERVNLEARFEVANEKLLACAQQADRPPPAADFGDASTRAAIDWALDEAARNAATCALYDGPKGRGRVKIIFNALDGKVESAAIDGAPFAGSVEEPCILTQFLLVRVGAFKAPRVTLTRMFTIQ